MLDLYGMRRLPSTFAWLFWEVDPNAIDLDVHRDYVLERVMSRGDWEAMRWLRGAYSNDVLASFLQRKGTRLAPRERAYWCVVSGAAVPAARGGGRPTWAGP
jgi:hypothetical protein